jgi:hypothetical protein
LLTTNYVRLLPDLVKAVGLCTVIIDALDECSKPSDLVAALETTYSTKQFKLFISSRPGIRIAPEFSLAYLITITLKENRKDIDSYIENEINSR